MHHGNWKRGAHGYWGRGRGGGAEESRELVACHAHLTAIGFAHAERLRVVLLRVNDAGIEVVDAVAGVGKPGGDAGEEGLEEARREGLAVGCRARRRRAKCV
jgi:hypothetical protein